MTPLKVLIQRGLNRLGFEIRKVGFEELDRLLMMLDRHRVDVVVDVGANAGQFALSLRRAGYRGRIVSFEPQTAAHVRLKAAAAADPLWDVAPRVAVGAAPGELTMNISDNSVSSSPLPILQAHMSSAPSSRYIGTETAPMIALDDYDHFPATGRIFLKIDTQGFEQQVLDGATELLDRAVGVLTELSLAPLYEGQAEYLSIFSGLRDKGFDCWAINPGFEDRQSGRMLQCDATFFRAG